MVRRSKGHAIPRIFSAAIRRELEKTETIDDDGNLLTKAETLARLLVKKALGYTTTLDDGTVLTTPPERWAIELIYERMEGRTPAAEPEKPMAKTVAEKVNDMAKLSINSMARAAVKKDDDSQSLNNKTDTP